MISNIYGFPIYKVQISNRDVMMDAVDSNMNKIDNVSIWDSECLTTSTTDSQGAFKSIDVKNEVTRCVHEMIKELGLDLKLSLCGCNTHNCTNCDDIWMNVYNKGHSQETHVHYSENPNQKQPLFSFSYFAKYNPEKDAKFIFVNPSPPTTCKELYKLPSYTPDVCADVVEGDILIFPSFLLHRVEEQLEDRQRITISGNFYEQLKE